ncbi:restriction endonuclease subunit S [Ornithobacterium rhinotracheale]
MSYRRLGDYIELIDERNTNLDIDLLLGLSISKEFIPSVANTIGSNMSNYKIIRKGQFACSIMQVRRDGKMPIALLEDYDEAIISQAYPVFKIKNEKELLPQYLMMWFSREEFDRQATFYAVGGVRGSLEWEDFMNFELPIPDIEKQKAIVKEYQTLTHRIALNEALNQKLEETAQALYKHWFVDFEFPNHKGKPYQSSGGAIVYNEELDKEIPEGWEVKSLDNLLEIKYGKDYKHLKQGNIPLYGSGGIMNFVNDYLYNKPSVLIPRKGSLANILYVDEPFWSVDTMFYTKLINYEFGFYSFYYLKTLDFNALNVGSAVPSMTTKLLNSLRLIIPKLEILKSFHNIIQAMYFNRKVAKKENQLLIELQEVLLSKTSKVE